MKGRKRRDEVVRFLKKLHTPPNWAAVIVIGTTLIVCPLLIVAMVMDYGHALFAVVATVLCAALILYSAIVTVQYLVRLHRKILRAADKYTFTRNLRKNYEFRTLFFGIVAFLCNMGYTMFLIITALVYRSVWYGVIGICYVLLCVSRGGVLVQNNKDERRCKGDYQALQKAKVGTYRYCGVMMLVLSLALTLAVVELVMDGSGFRMRGWLIYVFAIVAAYKVVHACIHFIHSTKRDDLAVRSVRYINLTVTLISVLCLQTSILAASPLQGGAVAAINTVTGSLVCIITLALGVYMVSFSVQEKQRLLAQEFTFARAAEHIDPVGYNRDGYVDEREEILPQTEEFLDE